MTTLKYRVGLVREAGGLGDILGVGAAACGVRQREPGAEIIAFVPEDFIDVARHLSDVDRVISLGWLKDMGRRRNRDAPVDPWMPYLERVFRVQLDEVISLYCPGYLYEATANRIRDFGRMQVFAIAGGATSLQGVAPRWRALEGDDDAAKQWMDANGVSDSFIAVSFRACHLARTLPAPLVWEIVAELSTWGKVLWVDRIAPSVQGVVHLAGEIGMVAAVLKHARMSVVVESGIMHLSGVLGVPFVALCSTTNGLNCGVYKNWRALEGASPDCKVPCWHVPRHGWNERCKATGCQRWGGLRAKDVIEQAMIVWTMKETGK